MIDWEDIMRKQAVTNDRMEATFKRIIDVLDKLMEGRMPELISGKQPEEVDKVVEVDSSPMVESEVVDVDPLLVVESEVVEVDLSPMVESESVVALEENTEVVYTLPESQEELVYTCIHSIVISDSFHKESQKDFDVLTTMAESIVLSVADIMLLRPSAKPPDDWVETSLGLSYGENLVIRRKADAVTISSIVPEFGNLGLSLVGSDTDFPVMMLLAKQPDLAIFVVNTIVKEYATNDSDMDSDLRCGCNEQKRHESEQVRKAKHDVSSASLLRPMASLIVEATNGLNKFSIIGTTNKPKGASHSLELGFVCFEYKIGV